MVQKNNSTVLGMIIKERLRHFDMTQSELAKKVGTSNVYLNYILTGKRGGKKYIENIYKELNIDMDYISEQISRLYINEPHL